MQLDMYRVITVRFLKQGLGRKREVSRGPLHPDEQHANRWAEYLRAMGCYHEVRVEGSGPVRSRDVDANNRA